MFAVRRVAKSSSFRFRCCCSFLHFFFLLKFSHICICRIAKYQSHNQAMSFLYQRVHYVIRWLLIAPHICAFRSTALEVLPSVRLSRFSFSSKMHFVGFGVRLSTSMDVLFVFLFMPLAWLTVRLYSLTWWLNFGVVLTLLFRASVVCALSFFWSTIIVNRTNTDRYGRL